PEPASRAGYRRRARRKNDAPTENRRGTAEPLGLVAATTSGALRASDGRRAAAGHPAEAAADRHPAGRPGADRHHAAARRPAADPPCPCPAERDVRSSGRPDPRPSAALSHPWRTPWFVEWAHLF